MKGLVVITALRRDSARPRRSASRGSASLVPRARRVEKLREVAQACVKAGSPEAAERELDVRSKESIEAFCTRRNAGNPFE